MRWDWSLKVESNMYFPKGNYLGLDLKTLLQPWGSGDVNLGFDLTRVLFVYCENNCLKSLKEFFQIKP